METDLGTRSTMARILDADAEGRELRTAGDSDQGRFRLFDATERYLRQVSQSRPLVLVLDDLHNACLPSLGLLEFVAGRVADESLLLAIAVRDDEAPTGGPTAHTVSQLLRLPTAERLALQPLNEAELGDLLAVVMGRRPAPDLLKRIASETGGNPFFAIQVARLVEASAAQGANQAAIRIPWRFITSIATRSACKRTRKRAWWPTSITAKVLNRRMTSR